MISIKALKAWAGVVPDGGEVGIVDGQLRARASET
jgi:hypothetical protein